jgi:hypothetical protein
MNTISSLSKGLATVSALVFASLAPAAVVELDLSSWTPSTLDFPGNQGAANWVLQPGNKTVRQVVNADPSFFLNNLNQTKFSIDGKWLVTPGDGDNDFIGFVFGYQNSSNFYLFDWKAGAQNNGGGSAAEGMTIKKYTGATGNGLTDLSIGELWENQNNLGDMTVLAKNHGPAAGWVNRVEYDFHLDFNLNPGEVSIIVKQGATELWNQTVVDNTFLGGQFGFYNNSQGGVEYAGFTQTGGIPTPDPVPESGKSMLLLSLGLISAGLLKRRQQRAGGVA